MTQYVLRQVKRFTERQKIKDIKKQNYQITRVLPNKKIDKHLDNEDNCQHNFSYNHGKTNKCLYCGENK